MRSTKFAASITVISHRDTEAQSFFSSLCVSVPLWPVTANGT